MDDAITSSKMCFKCGQTKARTEFYRHPRMRDGLLGKCKQCATSDSNAYRLASLDKVREYDRQRSKLPERIRLSAQISARWRKADARRSRCHNAVTRAVRSGRLLRQPCSVCGSPKSEAHHE